MRDQSFQPSQIIFPVALDPAAHDDTHEDAGVPRASWGWLEFFVLVQVLWGVLLFVPGSQAYRVYIRGFPYVASLVALGVCLRSSAADTGAPGARWILASLALMIFSLVHPSTWLISGTAQIVFQLSIAAPVFWTARHWLTAERLERVLLLVFGANFLSAAIGLLQVYYPQTFMPPEFSRLALSMNANVVGALTYIGADGREIIRPPGLSDIPGGAAISATVTALLGFAFATRAQAAHQRRVLFLASAVIGLTVVYLTQVRSMLVMICLCMLAAGAVRLRHGRVAHTAWIVGSATALVVGSFSWAVAVGGESVVDRFQSMLQVGVVQSYQENRGIFLTYTLQELLYEYPFGAGIGRWGMMSAYFGEPTNWQFPALWAEIQLTGWLYDGGVLLWICYAGAIATTTYHTYRIAGSTETHISDLATMVLSVQVLVIGLCFTGPVFNTQMGIVFWLLSASVYGAERTAFLSQELGLETELADGESGEADAEDPH
jgi:hypothetical protein